MHYQYDIAVIEPFFPEMPYGEMENNAVKHDAAKAGAVKPEQQFTRVSILLLENIKAENQQHVQQKC
jgi:hypothetical protein